MDRFVKTDKTGRVISIRYGSEMLDGEIKLSENANIGLGYVFDGVGFLEPIEETPIKEPSQLDRIESLLVKIVDRLGVE